MSKRIKLNFEALQRELDVLTPEMLSDVMGGVMTNEQATGFANFYAEIKSFQETELLKMFDNYYPGSILDTKGKLKYLKDNENPGSPLGAAYISYKLSVDLAEKATLLKTTTSMTGTQKDNLQLEIHAASSNLFNVVNAGGPTSTNPTQIYLVVKTADELEKYFRATGMNISIERSYLNGQETISRLILPEHNPGDTLNYTGYGILNVTNDTIVDKGKYANYNGTTYKIDINGLSSYLFEQGFSPLSNNYGGGSTTPYGGGTTDPNGGITTPYDGITTPYDGITTPYEGDTTDPNGE